VETVRGELYSATYQLRVHKLGNMGLEQHIAATFDFAALTTFLDAKGMAEFLHP
jgi:hypothetical protein